MQHLTEEERRRIISWIVILAFCVLVWTLVLWTASR